MGNRWGNSGNSVSLYFFGLQNHCMAAAEALAGLISDDELNEEYIIPKAFDPRVGPAVAKAVAEAARATGVARI